MDRRPIARRRKDSERTVRIAACTTNQRETETRPLVLRLGKPSLEISPKEGLESVGAAEPSEDPLERHPEGALLRSVSDQLLENGDGLFHVVRPPAKGRRRLAQEVDARGALLGSELHARARQRFVLQPRPLREAAPDRTKLLVELVLGEQPSDAPERERRIGEALIGEDDQLLEARRAIVVERLCTTEPHANQRFDERSVVARCRGVLAQERFGIFVRRLRDERIDPRRGGTLGAAERPRRDAPLRNASARPLLARERLGGKLETSGNDLV